MYPFCLDVMCPLLIITKCPSAQVSRSIQWLTATSAMLEDADMQFIREVRRSSNASCLHGSRLRSCDKIGHPHTVLNV